MNARSFVAAGALLLAAVGCRDDGGSPTEPAPTTPQVTVSAAVALAFYQVSAGSGRTCGVTLDHRAYCWGSGPLGGGTESMHLTPVAVAGGLLFRNVTAGASHACGVTTGYRAYCWGVEFYGEIGDGAGASGLTPLAVAGGLRFRSVSMSAFYTCGVSYPDGRPYCWGRNASGQLGDGNTTDRPTPVPVAGGHQFRQVGVGDSHTCGVTTDSRAFCWGADDVGQLGDGSEARSHLRPVLVAGGHQFRQLDVGDYHTCGVTILNRALCWGSGSHGEIGDGKTLNRFTPRAVAGGLAFDRVTAGYSKTCGESTGDRVYCWGWNLYGGSATAPRSDD